MKIVRPFQPSHANTNDGLSCIVRTSILAACAEFKVSVEVNSATDRPRLGALEVSHDKAVLFSKLKSGLWPHIQAVAQHVRNYCDAVKNRLDTNKFTVKGASINTLRSPPKMYRPYSPPANFGRTGGFFPPEGAHSHSLQL